MGAESSNTGRERAVAFRPLAGADLPLIQRWLADPDVAAWWREADLSLDALVGKFQPMIDGAEPVHPFVIEIDGHAIGYIQAYRIGDHPAYQRQLAIDPDAVATDLFIGEAGWRNRGWGGKVVHAFLDQIVFGELAAGLAVIAPEPANARAIRAYARVGFQWEKTVPVLDDDSGTTSEEYVMLLRRSDFTRRAK